MSNLGIRFFLCYDPSFFPSIFLIRADKIMNRLIYILLPTMIMNQTEQLIYDKNLKRFIFEVQRLRL